MRFSDPRGLRGEDNSEGTDDKEEKDKEKKKAWVVPPPPPVKSSPVLEKLLKLGKIAGRALGLVVMILTPETANEGVDKGSQGGSSDQSSNDQSSDQGSGSEQPSQTNSENQKNQGTVVYRVFGGGATRFGQPSGGSYTPANPYVSSNYRFDAGLYPSNTGDSILYGRISSMEGVITRPASPGPNGGGCWPEYVVPNAAQRVIVDSVKQAKPSF
jgi:hypothetical protein